MLSVSTQHMLGNLFSDARRILIFSRTMRYKSTICQADALKHRSMFCQMVRSCSSRANQFRFRDTRRILVVSKTTRYENEISRAAALQHGSNVELLRRTHEVHEAAVQALVAGLQKLPWPIEVKVVKSYDGLHHPTLVPEDIDSVDVVFSAGGDGTFVRTASFVEGSAAPVLIGVNTDPSRSEGFLCVDHSIGGVGRSLCGGDPAKRMSYILERLCADQAVCVERQRIRVERVPIGSGYSEEGDGHSDSSPSKGRSNSNNLRILALNDVLVAENMAQKTSYYDFIFLPALKSSLSGVSSEIQEKHKSSGILISTGTGSSAWHRTTGSVEPRKLQRILRFALKKKNVSHVDLKRIADQYNESLIFAPNLEFMRFTVREPIVNGVFSCDYPSGSARRIVLRPRSEDLRIFVDGQHIAPLLSNHEARFSVEPEDALRCVHFPRDLNIGSEWQE